MFPIFIPINTAKYSYFCYQINNDNSEIILIHFFNSRLLISNKSGRFISLEINGEILHYLSNSFINQKFDGIDLNSTVRLDTVLLKHLKRILKVKINIVYFKMLIFVVVFFPNKKI